MTGIVIAAAIGFIAGVLVGRGLAKSGDERGTRTFRPTKRQRQILDTLPPDPVVPSIQELVLAEAEELGVDLVPGADRVPLHVRLRVWKRDRDAMADCEDGSLRFRIRESVDPRTANIDDVALVCEEEPPPG